MIKKNNFKIKALRPFMKLPSIDSWLGYLRLTAFCALIATLIWLGLLWYSHIVLAQWSEEQQQEFIMIEHAKKDLQHGLYDSIVTEVERRTAGFSDASTPSADASTAEHGVDEVASKKTENAASVEEAAPTVRNVFYDTYQ